MDAKLVQGWKLVINERSCGNFGDMAGLTEDAGSRGSWFPFFWFDGRRAEGQDQHVRENGWRRRSGGKVGSRKFVRPKFVRPNSQFVTESSSHDLGVGRDLECLSGVNE